jgi:hypothetical protein
MLSLALFHANINGHLTVPTFPFQDNHPLRTTESIAADGDIGTPEHPSHGIKGPTALGLIDDFDPVLAFDYQHDACIGHVAKLLDLLFGADNRDEVFSVRDQLPDFDRLMTSVKAPSFISRPPQPYSKISHWKGTN